jgi:hypothetical protein
MFESFRGFWYIRPTGYSLISRKFIFIGQAKWDIRSHRLAISIDDLQDAVPANTELKLYSDP